MSKRQKISFYDLSRKERIVLSAVSEAMRQKDRSIRVDIGKKRCYVSVHPWHEERTEQIAEWINDGAIPTGSPGEYVAAWKCSNCGKIITAKTAYCPDCGARMEVSGDAPETE